MPRKRASKKRRPGPAPGAGGRHPIGDEALDGPEWSVRFSKADAARILAAGRQLGVSKQIVIRKACESFLRTLESLGTEDT